MLAARDNFVQCFSALRAQLVRAQGAEALHKIVTRGEHRLGEDSRSLYQIFGARTASSRATRESSLIKYEGRGAGVTEPGFSFSGCRTLLRYSRLEKYRFSACTAVVPVWSVARSLRSGGFFGAEAGHRQAANEPPALPSIASCALPARSAAPRPSRARHHGTCVHQISHLVFSRLPCAARGS